VAEGQRQLRVHHFVSSEDPNYGALNNATSAPWEVLATVTDNDIPAVVYAATAIVTEGTCLPLALAWLMTGGDELTPAQSL
jgi:hypothetical protein